MNIRDLFETMGLERFSSTGTKGWWKFNNPLDKSGKKTAARVNFDLGMVKDHRLKYTKPLYRFLMDALDFNYREAIELVGQPVEDRVRDYAPEKNNTILPKGYVGLEEGIGALAIRARRYLTERGFDTKELDRKGFGYVDEADSFYFGRIIIPVHGDGKLRFWLGRDFIGQEPKYLNETKGRGGVLYNEDYIYEHSKLYVTEGWSDAETMQGGVAMLGKTLDTGQKLKLLRAVENGFLKELIFVADKGFYEDMYQNAKPFIGNCRVKIINPEGERGDDANEIGRERMKELEAETEYITKGNKHKIFRENARPVNTH